MSEQPKVIVYSTPICPYCVSLQMFLDEHKIEYEKINVAEDKEAADRMIKKSGQRGVPVCEIGDEIVVGFDRVRISKLLNIKE